MPLLITLTAQNFTYPLLQNISETSKSSTISLSWEKNKTRHSSLIYSCFSNALGGFLFNPLLLYVIVSREPGQITTHGFLASLFRKTKLLPNSSNFMRVFSPIVCVEPAFRIAAVLKIGENILESWNSKFYEFWIQFGLLQSRCKTRKSLSFLVLEKQLYQINGTQKGWI